MRVVPALLAALVGLPCPSTPDSSAREPSPTAPVPLGAPAASARAAAAGPALDLAREIVVSLAVPPRGSSRARPATRIAVRASALGLEVVAPLARALEAEVEPGVIADGAAPPAARGGTAARSPASPAGFDLDPGRVFLLRARDGASARLAARSLASDPEVEWLEPNLPREAAEFPLDGSLPDDPLLGQGRQWALWNAAGADIGAREAWTLSCGANELILAIADTGVDPDHPDLQRRLPDGTPRLIRGRDVSLDLAGSWADSVAHGTSVAGVMAALTNDGPHFDSLGVAGICGGDGRDNAGCRLVPIKIAAGHGTTASSFEIASGIVYAATARARVLNLSFAGFGSSDLERRALYYALTRGCVVVAAAGNRGATAPTAAQYPAAYAAEGLCIQVGASDALDRRAAFSSYGPGLDLVAPGVEVWTTAPTYPNAYGSHWPGYQAGWGTSFAAPCVSGAAGLLLARRPELSDTDLQHVLRESAHDIGEPGVDAETGWGRLDAAAALRAIGPSIGIAHDERGATYRPTGVFGTLAVGTDSFGSFDRAAWWSGRLAEEVEVSVRIMLPDSFLDAARVWPRVGGTMALPPGFRLDHYAPWAEVAARDGREATLRGYLYRLPNAAPDSAEAWLPLPPDQARIAFSIVGPVRRPAAVSRPLPAVASFRVAPNPARGRARMSGPPGAWIALLDVAGRRILTARLDPDHGAFEWDGRDQSGRRVHPGLYFLRGEGAFHGSEPALAPYRFVVLE
jgi:hypothetical protein